MNIGYAVSDLVLALACLFIAVRSAKTRPGIALACAVIAAAALVGVARFSGVANAGGAHKFLSLMGSTAALPLLAAAIAWPESKAAKAGRGASLVILVGSALGIAVVVGAGLALWGQVVPAASALVILVATFGVVAANLNPAGLAPLEILHYGMTVALLLLCL